MRNVGNHEVCPGCRPPGPVKGQSSTISVFSIWPQARSSTPEAPVDLRSTDDLRPIAQLPPEAGLVADEGVAVPAFLCIFLCELVVAGAMVLAPDAPETESVEPPGFGLLIPVPPWPPAAPPPALWAKTPPDIPTKSAEIKTPFVAARIAVSSSTNRLTPDGVSPVRDRNPHTTPVGKAARNHLTRETSVAKREKCCRRGPLRAHPVRLWFFPHGRP